MRAPSPPHRRLRPHRRSPATPGPWRLRRPCHTRRATPHTTDPAVSSPTSILRARISMSPDALSSSCCCSRKQRSHASRARRAFLGHPRQPGAAGRSCRWALEPCTCDDFIKLPRAAAGSVSAIYWGYVLSDPSRALMYQRGRKGNGVRHLNATFESISPVPLHTTNHSTHHSILHTTAFLPLHTTAFLQSLYTPPRRASSNPRITARLRSVHRRRRRRLSPRPPPRASPPPPPCPRLPGVGRDKMRAHGPWHWQHEGGPAHCNGGRSSHA